MVFTWYLQNLHYLEAVKIVFFKLFLIYIFKNNILAENWTKAGEIGKKLSLGEFVELNFCNSV